MPWLIGQLFEPIGPWVTMAVITLSLVLELGLDLPDSGVCCEARCSTGILTFELTIGRPGTIRSKAATSGPSQCLRRRSLRRGRDVGK